MRGRAWTEHETGDAHAPGDPGASESGCNAWPAVGSQDAENGAGPMRLCAPRIAVIWLVLGVGATLAAGCASGAASAKETANERADARMFASGVNLGGPDLPGFTIVLEGEGKPAPLDLTVEQCDGGPVVHRADHGVSSPLLQERGVPEHDRCLPRTNST